MQKQTIFITGGAGYVGAMLCDQFSKRDDVEKIIALDKEPRPEMLQGNQKIEFIESNTADMDWQDRVALAKPSVIIHTAWQIREIYGNRGLSWKWNINGSDNVFAFAFAQSSVRKLIYFSTVASYGAFPQNTITYRYTEHDPFRVTDYLYAEEKRVTEDYLRTRYEGVKAAHGQAPQVFIVRPAAITGPRGRYDRIRFGLQSALSGQLKQNFVYRIISMMTAFVPTTKNWLRQYIHEDDVTDIVETLAFNEVKGEYEVFNICPPGDVVLGKDMAKAVNKKTIPVHPYLIRFVFFMMWHLTRGKVPTAQGSWKGYSYPIAVDGSKVSAHTGYHYTYPSKEAFVNNVGRYAKKDSTV